MYNETNFLEPGRDLTIFAPVISNSEYDKILEKIGFLLLLSVNRDFGLRVGATQKIILFLYFGPWVILHR